MMPAPPVLTSADPLILGLNLRYRITPAPYRIDADHNIYSTEDGSAEFALTLEEFTPDTKTLKAKLSFYTDTYKIFHISRDDLSNFLAHTLKGLLIIFLSYSTKDSPQQLDTTSPSIIISINERELAIITGGQQNTDFTHLVPLVQQNLMSDKAISPYISDIQISLFPEHSDTKLSPTSIKAKNKYTSIRSTIIFTAIIFAFVFITLFAILALFPPTQLGLLIAAIGSALGIIAPTTAFTLTITAAIAALGAGVFAALSFFTINYLSNTWARKELPSQESTKPTNLMITPHPNATTVTHPNDLSAYISANPTADQTDCQWQQPK